MTRTTALLMILLARGVLFSTAAQQRDIRKIDFRNFTYPWHDGWESAPPDEWHWITTPAESKVKLSHGIHRFEDEAFYPDEPFPAPAVVFDSTRYGDLTGDGNEEAVVDLNYSTGGTANWDYLYVFRMSGGKPSLMARLQAGSRGYGGLVGISVRKGLLVLEFADKDQMVGDCCSKGFIRVRYRWTGNHFVEVGHREHGDMDLQTGRPLPSRRRATQPTN